MSQWLIRYTNHWSQCVLYLSVVQYTFIVHAVHDGHESLKPSHRLSLIPFAHEVRTETWNHPLG